MGGSFKFVFFSLACGFLSIIVLSQEGSSARPIRMCNFHFHWHLNSLCVLAFFFCVIKMWKALWGLACFLPILSLFPHKVWLTSTVYGECVNLLVNLDVRIFSYERYPSLWSLSLINITPFCCWKIWWQIDSCFFVGSSLSLQRFLQFSLFFGILTLLYESMGGFFLFFSLWNSVHLNVFHVCFLFFFLILRNYLHYVFFPFYNFIFLLK